MEPTQYKLPGIVEGPRIDKIVEVVANTVADRTISIPEIIVVPKRRITFRFNNFDLADLETINARPVEEGLVIQNLRTEARLYLARNSNDPSEARAEDYLLRYLIDRNEIDYDEHADLLYKLAGQVVARVRTYLQTAADVENVLLRHGRQLADFIFAQMMQHYEETPLGPDDYEVRVTRGFALLRAQPLNVAPGQNVRNFRHAATPLSETKRQVFGGFKKCCYPLQKFDSDPERRFAVLIDAAPSVEKWLKPGRTQFQIEYRSGDGYEPDFVVETAPDMLICEVKARKDLADPDVQMKASAATKWCKTATAHTPANPGKSWTYLLIPDDQITGGATLEGLRARFAKQ
ncbi:MAG: hypothetical protein L0H73_05635 [Nitrococcus sp.]|nr:hypothetical protein [Nitrococcus sp.]